MPKTTTRDQYEAAKRNQASMRQVNALLTAETGKVLSVAKGLGQQEMGGFLRATIPGLIDKYGNVNAAVAMKYYDEQRELALTGTGLKDYRRGSQRIAAAKLEAQIYVATTPKFEPVKTAEPIIGYGMAQYLKAGEAAMDSAVTNALTRAVASYNRDVMLYNSALDDASIGVQRVAEPTACSFCALMAFSSTRSASGNKLDIRTTKYAVDFHDNCHCSIETLYVGDKPIRPDYYDQFEDEYLEVYKGNGVKDTLAEWRGATGRK